MGSFSERRGNTGAFTASTGKRIQEVKNWLVLEVATQSGAFWEQVRETRARWDVQAPTKLPPKDSNLLYPERLHRSQAENSEQCVYDSHNWDRDVSRLSSWLAVPGLDRYRENVDWRPLMSALVLYQPPLDTLLEFAEYQLTPPTTERPTSAPEDGLPASWPADHPARLALERHEPESPRRRGREDASIRMDPSGFGL